MHGLVGCIVEVGHWRDSEGVGEPPKWVAEYEARVVAVSQGLSFVLVMSLVTGELRRVNTNNVIVPESERDWSKPLRVDALWL